MEPLDFDADAEGSGHRLHLGETYWTNHAMGELASRVVRSVSLRQGRESGFRPHRVARFEYDDQRRPGRAGRSGW